MSALRYRTTVSFLQATVETKAPAEAPAAAKTTTKAKQVCYLAQISLSVYSNTGMVQAGGYCVYVHHDGQ